MSNAERFQKALEKIRNQGRFRELKIDSGVSFSHNDYLGLSQHPEVISHARKALEVGGSGSRGSRLLGGNSRLHERVESELAQYFQAPQALLFSSGYLANLTIVTVMAKWFDRIYSDEKNHASLIDGIRLSGKEKTIVAHAKWNEVNVDENALLVTESLFSMDGDFIDEKCLKELASQKQRFLIVDEAHAAGAFGKKGRGWFLDGTIDWDRTAVVVTFGKSLGAQGACVLCSDEVAKLIVNEGRAFIFTTSGCPAAVGAVSGSLKVLSEQSWRREELWERAESVRQRLKECGIEVAQGGWGAKSPIIPVGVSGNANVLRFCENMRELGIGVQAIRWPTVAQGAERIRLSLSLLVSRDNTLEMADQLGRLWMESSLQAPTLGLARQQSVPV